MPFLAGLLVVSFAAIRKPPLVVAYVPNFHDLKASIPDIDFGKLTHINLAFENPINDQGDLSFDPLDKLLIDQARKTRVKVLLSIGGGAVASDPDMVRRYHRLISDRNRRPFIAKLKAYLEKHHFDGIDVDIEGPVINRDYPKLIEDLEKTLRSEGKLLTAALSQGYGGEKVPLQTLQRFDFINVMAYDATGPWEKSAPGPHSTLQFAKENAEYWLQRGVPRSKVVLGLPFYGYGFGKAFREEDYAYRDLVAKYPKAHLLDQVGETIHYNGIPTIRAKAHYIREKGLAGAMIWCLDFDAKGDKSLLNVIYKETR